MAQPQEGPQFYNGGFGAGIRDPGSWAPLFILLLTYIW